MERFFAKDVIEAAKSDAYFDNTNAKEISDTHGIDYSYVLKEIQFVRTYVLKHIDPE